jgi:hypothetical protein
MKKIEPLFLSATLLITPAQSQVLTSDDYPPGRPATFEELSHYCSAPDSDEGMRLLSYIEGSEYPFRLLSCPSEQVRPYKCSTLRHLLDFRYDMIKAFGPTENEEDKTAYEQFEDLGPVYIEYCLDNLS